MKKTATIILLTLLIFNLTACSNDNPTIINELPSETTATDNFVSVSTAESEHNVLIEYDNNAENLSFGSFASISDGWIYYTYTDFTGYFDNNKSYIYKVRNDGTEETLVYSHFDGIHGISALNNWIYFIGIKEGTIWSEDFDYNQDYVNIYKIRTDGTEKTEIISYNHSFNNLYITEDWIYYDILEDESFCLYKINTDGTEAVKLTSNTIQPNYIVNIIGDWIYYCVYNSIQNQIIYYKIRTDGTQETELTDNEKIRISFYIIDDWSYYTDNNDNNNIYKINMYNDETVKLNSDNSRYMNVINNWIYYVNEEDSNIYKISTDGTGRTRITDGIYFDEYDFATGMIVAGDWIYYECESRKSGPGPLCRIKTNGTGFKILKK